MMRVYYVAMHKSVCSSYLGKSEIKKINGIVQCAYCPRWTIIRLSLQNIYTLILKSEGASSNAVYISFLLRITHADI